MPAYDYSQSLDTAALELKYERSRHLVDIIAKDENIRKLRFEVHVLEDDCDELRDLLAKEEDRSEKLEKIVNGNLVRAEEAEAALQDLEDEVVNREQELSTLRVSVAPDNMRFATDTYLRPNAMRSRTSQQTQAR